MKSLYTMVGMQHRHSEHTVNNLARGERLELRRAPDNPHDPNAIEVWYGSEFVAFIKAVEAVRLARSMDNMHRDKIVGKFAIGGDRWPQVEIDW